MRLFPVIIREILVGFLKMCMLTALIFLAVWFFKQGRYFLEAGQEATYKVFNGTQILLERLFRQENQTDF